MRVTIRQVAERAEVSVPAVSQALNGTGTLRAATRQRIVRVAREMGYRPNSAARATRKQRFNNVALVLPESSRGGMLPADLLSGVHVALEEAQLTLSLARLPDEKLTSEGFVPRLLAELSADGLLINYNAFIPPKMLELIERYRLPSIWFNTLRDHDCVRPADEEGAWRATSLLLEHGHRRVAFVSYGEQVHYSSIARCRGYTRAMEAAGLVPRAIQEKVRRHGDAAVQAFTEQWLLGPDRPTAILTSGEYEALAVAGVASRHGLRIPEQFSLMSFSVGAQSALDAFGLTTMVLPERAMGEVAVRLLLEKLRGDQVRHEPRLLPCTLSRGRTVLPLSETTRCPGVKPLGSTGASVERAAPGSARHDDQATSRDG